MEHIKQNTQGLKTEIQKIGCFFRSALLLAEMQSGKTLEIEQINLLWDKAKKYGFIDQNDNVKSSARIANLALNELGIRGRFIECGTFKDGKQTWYQGVEKKVDYFIQKIRQAGPSVTHFRVVDRFGDLIEDPHAPPINVLGIYYTICYQFKEK